MNSIISFLFFLIFTLNLEPTIASQGFKVADASFSDSVSVTKQKIEFFFPVDQVKNWKWHDKNMDTGSLEYEWNATFKLSKNDYGAGFLLFKHPAAQPGSGTFEDLIKEGQVSLFETRILERTMRSSGDKVMMSGIRSLIRKAKIYHEITDQYLVIVLKEDNLIDQFYEGIPEFVSFSSKTPDGEYKMRNVKVTYHY